MLFNLIQALFGERSTVTPESQVNDTAPKDGISNDEKSLSEIQRLEQHYGELHQGMVINTTLQEILAVIPKKRARIDAYGTLVKNLERDYGVKLIITSRKHSKNTKQ